MTIFLYFNCGGGSHQREVLPIIWTESGLQANEYHLVLEFRILECMPLDVYHMHQSRIEVGISGRIFHPPTKIAPNCHDKHPFFVAGSCQHILPGNLV